MNSKSFDLNIEKILENWEVRHAVREVIANALDEQLLSGTSEVVIAKQGSAWIVRDFGRGLKHTHLTQNENEEKLNHPAVIGRFGIGLKDALATFERHGVQVVIRSRYGTIHTAKATKHGFGDIFTLHAVIDEPVDAAFEGTEFEMTGVDDSEMLAAKQLFLKFSGQSVVESTRHGQIITRSDGSGSIYINGVKVAQEDNFLFSYNITQLTAALKKAINRERSHVGRSAYTDSVKKILLVSESAEVAGQLSADIARYQTGAMHDELAWLDVQEHAVKILNAQRPVMMVTAQEAMAHPDLLDQAREAGKIILTIPENLRAKIADGVDLQGNRLVDLTAFAQTYNDSFLFDFVAQEHLTSTESLVFGVKDSILEVFGGLPERVKAIRLSNTMRPDLMFGSRTVGCWDPETESIVIWREQLRTVPKFAGTLLHELVHAKTGCEDVTRGFETALTDLLGQVYEAWHKARYVSAPAPAPALGTVAPSIVNTAPEFSVMREQVKVLAGQNTLLQSRLMVAGEHLSQVQKTLHAEKGQVEALEEKNTQLQSRLSIAYEHLSQIQETLHTEKVRSAGLASKLRTANSDLEDAREASLSKGKRPWYRLWR